MKNKTNFDKVKEVNNAMGLPMNEPWIKENGYNHKLEGLRFSLIEEEFKEFEEAVDKENMLKELADLLYVVYGYAATYNLDIDTAFNRVHKSNMSKLGSDGKPILREDGKILKGINYKEPDLSDLVK